MTQKQLLQAAGDGTAVPQGYVGEIISAQANTSTIVGGTRTDLAVATLTPGTWLVMFNATMYAYDSSATYEAQIICTQGPSNTEVFFDAGVGFNMRKAASGNNYLRSTFSMQTTVSLSTSTVYKIRYQDNSGTGTKNLWAEVRAVRIA